MQGPKERLVSCVKSLEAPLAGGGRSSHELGTGHWWDSPCTVTVAKYGTRRGEQRV